MRGVEVALGGLQPVALEPELGRRRCSRRDVAVIELRERRLPVLRAHVGEDDATGLAAGVGGDLDLVPERVAFGRVRHVDALAVDVELPAVVDAAQAVLVVAAEEHRRAAVRAVRIDQADAAVGVTEGDEVLVEDLDLDRDAVGPGSSSESATGIQKRRNSSPMGVPGLVLVRSSLSSFDSTAILPLCAIR